MKGIFIFLIFSTYLHSQNITESKIENTLIVPSIELEIRKYASYLKDYKDNTLRYIQLFRIDGNRSLLHKTYAREQKISLDSILKNHDSNKNGFEIPTKLFDSIANELISLNAIKINNSQNFNIADGIHYSIVINGYGNTIYMITDSPEIDTEHRDLTNFLSICRRIWSLENP